MDPAPRVGGARERRGHWAFGLGTRLALTLSLSREAGTDPSASRPSYSSPSIGESSHRSVPEQHQLEVADAVGRHVWRTSKLRPATQERARAHGAQEATTRSPARAQSVPRRRVEQSSSPDPPASHHPSTNEATPRHSAWATASASAGGTGKDREQFGDRACSLSPHRLYPLDFRHPRTPFPDRKSVV